MATEATKENIGAIAREIESKNFGSLFLDMKMFCDMGDEQLSLRLY